MREVAILVLRALPASNYRMSKNAKIVIGVLVVIALALIVYQATDYTPEASVPATTDESFSEDAAALDAELSGLESDQALIDEGLEDDLSAE